ncbi:hypothetical protein AXG93_4052s1000 [Marchantia polymorpha subsp. ruderalis]|uniref:Uncharacterized protein n=1 Tax=Marchantia polymorpha subsp. ruderalis TaxID=1480154 RepID=A0A176WS40_MARPO|nr:hypothetical protein AXG93_4052s1000 [Marchantia polymorpha subsp. ruderalis]
MKALKRQTKVMRLRTSKRRARPKKKANRKVVVSKSLKGSVAMTEEAASITDEDTRKEVNLWTARAGPSGVQNEDTVEDDVEPLGERTMTTSQGLQPSERKQPSSKKNKTHIKRATAVKTVEETKRECAEATAKVAKRVASLTLECATMTVNLQEREEHLRAKKMECEILRLNLAKKELRAAEELRTKGFRREMAVMKTERMELWGRIEARTEAHNKELQRANELMASLAEQMKKGLCFSVNCFVSVVNLCLSCAFVKLCVLSPCMVRFSLSKLSHLKLRVFDSDVPNVPGAIRDLSKFECEYSGQKAESEQFSKDLCVKFECGVGCD